MSATARHHMRFLLAVAVATTVASSAAEARHWRYYWHYCPPSALVGQIRQIEEGSVSGSS
jgi:hypothetical protein